MIYDLNIYKLIISITPSFLRKPVVLAFLKCFSMSMQTVFDALFTKSRNAHIYALKHNGQVCYLRKVLNDAFTERSASFQIEDVSERNHWQYARSEIEFPLSDPNRADEHLYAYSETQSEETTLLYDERYMVAETTPFVVKVPSEIYSSDESMKRVKSLVELYKLISKQPIYKSL